MWRIWLPILFCADPVTGESGDGDLLRLVEGRSAEVEGFSCEPRRTCGRMTSCAEAVHALEVCGHRARDGDDDGVPCESLCPGG